jgi:hypothetical protein
MIPIDTITLETIADSSTKAGRFPLGRVTVVIDLLATVPLAEIQAALFRHRNADWGNVCSFDRGKNERNLLDGERLLSIYSSELGIKFYIRTSGDRSQTVILLPYQE